MFCQRQRRGGTSSEAVWSGRVPTGGGRLPAGAKRARTLRKPYLAAARPRLSEARWDAAWTKGGRLGFEEAIAYALEKA